MLLIFQSACIPVTPAATPTQTTQPGDTPSPAVSKPALATSTIPLQTSTPEPHSTISVKPEDLRGVVIHFWHNWSGASGEVITAQVEEFNLTNPWGILAVEIYQGSLDEMDEKLVKSRVSIERPDLVVGYLHQALAWDKLVMMVDLEDYNLDPVWGYTLEEQVDFYPIFWEFDVYAGERLGVPAQRSGQLLFYNQSWAEELGYSKPPNSAEEFLLQACSAAQAESITQPGINTGMGGWVVSDEYPAVLSWLYAFKSQVFQEANSASGTSPYLFDEEEVLQAYSFLRNMYDKGCAWVAENPYPDTFFAERKAIFASGSVTDIPYFQAAMQRAGNQDRWTVLAYPGSDDFAAMAVYGPSFQILKGTEKEQLAAWLLTKWLLEPQNQAQLVETTFGFPLRISDARNLVQTGVEFPAWVAAVNLLKNGKSEPPFLSWSQVRWALSDSATQLFRSYTSLDQVPALVRFLDQTAQDIHRMVEENE